MKDTGVKVCFHIPHMSMGWCSYRFSVHDLNLMKKNRSVVIPDSQVPLLLIWINGYPAWLSDHIPSKEGDEITYPFPNFNGATVEASVHT